MTGAADFLDGTTKITEESYTSHLRFLVSINLYKRRAKRTPMTTDYTVAYRKEEEGGFSGRCLELPAAISQGETFEELQANMKDAISLVKESIDEEIRLKHKMVVKVQV